MHERQPTNGQTPTVNGEGLGAAHTAKYSHDMQGTARVVQRSTDLRTGRPNLFQSVDKLILSPVWPGFKPYVTAEGASEGKRRGIGMGNGERATGKRTVNGYVAIGHVWSARSKVKGTNTRVEHGSVNARSSMVQDIPSPCPW